jgi:hypothetical protein
MIVLNGNQKGDVPHLLDGGGSSYKQFVTPVIWRAVEDARAGDPLVRAWLSSSAAVYWYDALGLSVEFRAKLGALGASVEVYQLVLPGLAA